MGASDYLPNTIWVKNFLEAQGYRVPENFFEQDNESAIKLEKNGRMSAGPKSRHIAIRYFWIKDRSQSENITIRHCPTLAMLLADFFTKPLQGQLFRTFRDVLLGHAHVDTLTKPPMSPTEERVGEGPVVNHGAEATGVLDTVVVDTVVDSTVHGAAPKVTWAEVVRKPSSAATSGGAVCKSRGQDLSNRSKFVLRSLSRNNPVIRVKA